MLSICPITRASWEACLLSSAALFDMETFDNLVTRSVTSHQALNAFLARVSRGEENGCSWLLKAGSVAVATLEGSVERSGVSLDRPTGIKYRFMSL